MEENKEVIIYDNPQIKPEFIKYVTKKQLYRFYPKADKAFLDAEHDKVHKAPYSYQGELPEGKTLRKVTAGYLKANPDVAELGVSVGDMYPM